MFRAFAPYQKFKVENDQMELISKKKFFVYFFSARNQKFELSTTKKGMGINRASVARLFFFC